MKLDLSQHGMEIFYKPWLAHLVERLLTTKEEMNTRQAHQFLLVGGFTISRASVIYALQDLAKYRILIVKEVTGKGGNRGLYSRNSTLQYFWEKQWKRIEKEYLRAQTETFRDILVG